jgi:hypothetical protein
MLVPVCWYVIENGTCSEFKPDIRQAASNVQTAFRFTGKSTNHVRIRTSLKNDYFGVKPQKWDWVAGNELASPQ